MNDSINTSAELEHSVAETANRLPRKNYPNMVLPKRIYEALPVAYIVVGALFILGAVYIGIGHTPMVGYLAVGISCILAGVTVTSIRHSERSKSNDAESWHDRVSAEPHWS